MEESAKALVRKRLRIRVLLFKMSAENAYELKNVLGDGYA